MKATDTFYTSDDDDNDDDRKWETALFGVLFIYYWLKLVAELKLV